MERRTFLLALVAAGIALPNITLATQSQRAARFYSTRGGFDGRYYVSAFDEQGRLIFETPLPGRGHQLVLHPNLSQLAAPARRPDTFLLILDSEKGEVLHHLTSAEGRHFYGHALYSADGRWLYTTENDIESGNGMIAIRDVTQGYKQVGEFPTYGTGPHEFKFLADGKTFIVANGGILTRPETGRDKLNLASMTPSLVYIASDSGTLLEEQRLPETLNQNSLRHLALNKNDQVCCVAQYQGPQTDLPPLVAMHKRGESLQLLSAPESIQRQMKNYCGSACVDASGEWFAASSPQGNLITFWSAKQRAYVDSVTITDGCGIAPTHNKGEFILTSGVGGVYRYRVGQADSLQALASAESLNQRWDNHITLG